MIMNSLTVQIFLTIVVLFEEFKNFFCQEFDIRIFGWLWLLIKGLTCQLAIIK